jgi:predicted NBD/HSP70 family sugar kinase
VNVPPAATGRGGSLLRRLSDQAVLETIFRAGPITRPEISARTNLSKPTVSEAVRRLLQERLIRSAGVRSGNLGRSPISYVVDDTAGYVIGVDVGGENIRVAAVNLFGELLISRSDPQRDGGDRPLAQQVLSLVHEVQQTTAATHSQLLGVGASWTPPRPADPFELLRTRIGVPVFVDSSINLSAIGEKWRGLAARVSDFAFISVGAGVGAGIVVADELVRGAHHMAGLIADLPAAASSSGVRDADSMLERARELRWRAGLPESISELFARLDAEPSARRIMKEQAAAIAFAVATICSLLDPELVVLGGGIGSRSELLAPVRTATDALATRQVRVESSLLREQAALYGALAVALRDAHEQLFRRR